MKLNGKKLERQIERKKQRRQQLSLERSLTRQKIKEERKIEKNKLNKKTYFLVPHIGIGDIIWNIPLINYLSKDSKVELVCMLNNKKNIEYFFLNNKNVSLFLVQNNKDFLVRRGCPIEKFNKITENKIVLLSGNNKIPYDSCDVTKFPFFFYTDLNYDINILKTHFFLRNTNKSIELYNKIKNIDYIFANNLTSGGILYDIKDACISNNIDINKTFVCCSNENIYNKGHKFYELAESFIFNKNNLFILDYKLIIENAINIITTDSAIFCFIVQLKLKSTKNIMFGRQTYLNRGIKWNNIFNFYNLNFEIKKGIF